MSQGRKYRHRLFILISALAIPGLDLLPIGHALTQPRPDSTLGSESSVVTPNVRSTGGGLNGVVTLNTPEIDPSRELVALPVIFADVSRQIAQGCGNGNQTPTGRFLVTGRGGLPPNPSDTLSNDAILDDTRLPITTVRKKQSATVATTPLSSPDSVPIVPATGVMFNGNDEVTLIAAAPTTTLQIPWLSPTACRAYAS